MKITERIVEHFTMTPAKLRAHLITTSELALEKAKFAHENAEADIALLTKRLARLKGNHE